MEKSSIYFSLPGGEEPVGCLGQARKRFFSFIRATIFKRLD
jgi:hypothetical protein